MSRTPSRLRRFKTCAIYFQIYVKYVCVFHDFSICAKIFISFSFDASIRSTPARRNTLTVDCSVIEAVDRLWKVNKPWMFAIYAINVNDPAHMKREEKQNYELETILRAQCTIIIVAVAVDVAVIIVVFMWELRTIFIFISIPNCVRLLNNRTDYMQEWVIVLVAC